MTNEPKSPEEVEAPSELTDEEAKAIAGGDPPGAGPPPSPPRRTPGSD